MTRTAHVAIDLGAESGRVVLGVEHDANVMLHECHRFEHVPLPTPTGLCWNLTGIWREVLLGLSRAAQKARVIDVVISSVGVDSWAVDYALIDEASNELLGLPRCYRDPAFPLAFDRVRELLSPERIYSATGIQHLPFNTLYQFAERSRRAPALYASGARLAFVPDVLHWLLTGKATTERTNASTSQMVDTRTGRWNLEFLTELGLPTTALGDPLEPGTTIGTLRADVVHSTGLSPDVVAVLPPTHDTACAVAAVPAEPSSHWCYLSSGTWSLLGAELEAPCITDASSAANFTNELGVCGTVRFLKNISGLWLVQQLRRGFERAGERMDYETLTRQAEAADAFRTLIPVDDPVINRAANVAQAIQEYARRSGQAIPESHGQLVRCCLESLALEYRRAATTLEHVLGRRFEVLHVVGGGSKNALLNQMTANATGRRVVVGPEEATATGNVLVQAMGLGHLADLAAIRRVVRASVSPQVVEPGATDDWNEAHARYLALPAAS
ncbi:MAG: rhamnulokinase [Planctomycetes bacterium]|nr:rhamnulokinase [Planctomycetota bacterium]MCB9891791.1 rhamnulokinase [Planctomycetota bacterium]